MKILRLQAGLLLLLASSSVRAQDAGEETQPASDFDLIASALQPGVARGDFEFYVDVSSQRPAGPGQTLVRCLVQVPARAFLDQTKADRADLRLQVKAFAARTALEHLTAAVAGADSVREAAAQGDEALDALLSDFSGVPAAAEVESRTQIESADRSKLVDTDFRVYELALELPPADYVVEVVVQNLSRRKRGVLDRLRKRPLASTAKMLVRVPDLAREPALADPTFWIGYGNRSPYAARLYGLLNDSLHVRSTLFGHGDYLLRATATDRDGDVGWQDSMRVAVDGVRDVNLGASVSRLAAGQYVLALKVIGPQGSTSASRSFDVAWSLVTWKQSRRDLDLEAELALNEKNFDAYRSLPVGEKERYVEDFWKSMDPTPGTAQNEVLDEFHRRVAYADLNFSEAVRGALTDRGRVYVHYGPPAEILAEAMPSHLAGRGGEEALEKVDDVYVAEEHDSRTNWDRLGTDMGSSPTQRAAEQQERTRVIGPANEVVSYELWRYAAGGAPLMPEDKGIAIDGGLRVMFVDLTGIGRFRLRKSSVRLNINGLTNS